MSGTSHHFLRSARLIAALTMLSRILGLVRDIVCLRYFGAAIWHYFSLGFMIPNLFRRLFGEGALTAALVPVYTQTLSQGSEPAHRLERSVLTLLGLLLIGLAGVGLLILLGSRYGMQLNDKTILTLQLAALMLPYMILICLTATLGGMLQVHRRFAPPAATPIVLNVCLILTVWILHRNSGADRWEQIYGVAIAVLIAGLLQFAIQLPAAKQSGISLRPSLHTADPNVRKVARLMGPMMIGMSVYQFNVLLDSVIAWLLSRTDQTGETFMAFGHQIAYPVVEGSISYLYMSQRLYQLPLGVFGIALATAIFPVLSRQAVEKNHAALTETLAQGIRLVFFLGIPSAAGLILIGTPLMQVFFEGGSSRFTAADTIETFRTLRFYALGLPFLFLQQLIVRVFYSYEDARTPVRIAAVVVILNFILNLSLIWSLGTGGLALATVIGAVVQVGLLLIILLRRYGLHFRHGIVRSLFKTLAATAVMTAGCLGLLEAIHPETPLMRMLIILISCVVLYALASRLLQNAELRAAIHGH